jgi:hypothetical protein
MKLLESRALQAESQDKTIIVDLARGQLRATAAGVTYEGVAFGLLQTATGWSSVTGRLRSSSTRDERAFVLIVDEANGVISLAIDGVGLLTSTLQR